MIIDDVFFILKKDKVWYGSILLFNEVELTSRLSVSVISGLVL